MTRTPPDLPVPPNTQGIVLRSGRWTTESGELPNAPTAPNIATAALWAAPTSTAVDPPQRGVGADTCVNSPTRTDEDDGFVVASAAQGMRTAPPRGAVVVEGTPARTSTCYEGAFGGSTPSVLSGKAEEEDSQSLLSLLTDTSPPFPPLPQHQQGTGDGFRHLRKDCYALVDKREEDPTSINVCFDRLFEKHTKDMDRLLKRTEAKDAARQAQIHALFGRIIKLEKELHSALNAITTHLDVVVPQVIATVIEQTLPSTLATALQETIPPTIKTVLDDTLATALQETISPTLKTVLDDTISNSFVSIKDGSFLDFTTKVESLGTDMVQAVRRSVAAAEGPLLDCYTAVKEEYSACKACLDEVLDLLLTRSDMPAAAPPPSHTPPVNPGGDATVPSSSPPLAQAKDAPSDTPLADSASTPVDECRHPSFPPGRVEDFDFSYSPHREFACLGYPPPRGASVHFHPRGGQERVPPPGVDTGGNTVPGGRITTPRFSDCSCVACAKNTSKFDAAGLAEAKYHIGEYGVEVLTPPIISNCGYQLFHRDHSEDIHLCYNEISNIHRVVLQGWVNSQTHFCSPVIEYILEKAIPVFPRLSSLKVADVVKFYDSMQKISM
jgi:hypothetical protein